MLRSSLASIFLQLFIDVTDNNKFDRDENDGNKINQSNLSTFKKSIKAVYLIFEQARKSGGNTKKGVKAAESSD